MNKRILLIKISIVIFITILLIGNLLPQTNPLKNKFSFGIVSELLRNWKYQTNFHFGNYNDLKLDVIQSYSNRGDNDDPRQPCFGGFYDTLNSYRNAVIKSIDTTNTIKVFERAKIVRSAYGQRSTYQAEPLSSSAFPKYGYTDYKNRPGEYYEEQWGPEYIKGWKCETGKSYGAGYIVKDLIENCEQINRPYRAENKTWDIEYMISDNKDPDWKWYIKPSMRIDTNVIFI